MELTFIVDELDWDYENRGGVSIGENISMQLGMAAFLPAPPSKRAQDRVLIRVPEIGLHEVSGEVSSAIAIGACRAAIVDCGVPVRIGYDSGLPVPRPLSKVAGFGVLQAFISFDDSPLHTPLSGVVIDTKTMGKMGNIHLVIVKLNGAGIPPKWMYDWRPTLFSKAVPRPLGLRIRIRKHGDLYAAEAFDLTQKGTWMSLNPKPLGETYELLHRLGWSPREIIEQIEGCDPNWRNGHPEFKGKP